MNEEIQDVKQAAEAPEVSAQEEGTVSTDSEVVKTQDAKVDRDVYEKVKEAMKSER
jgi:hypothetical protein